MGTVATVKSSIVKPADEEGEVKQNLNLVLKADVLGSLEAIMQSLESFKDPEISLKIIKSGLTAK